METPPEQPDGSRRPLVHEVALRADRFADRLSRRLRGTPKRITVEPYLAHGSSDRVVARGRVVSNAPILAAEGFEPVWTRVRRGFRRFLTNEIAGVEIEAALGSATGVGITDEEGYYWIELAGHALPADRLIHHLDLSVKEPPAGAVVTIGSARAHIPTGRTRRLVVSDIDDTVLATDATRTARMIMTTLSGSAWTRRGFPGTPELFGGLARGGDGEDDNAFVYVSSSPWNLHGFLDAFIRHTGLPTGPLLLRDFGVDETMFIQGSHDAHKRAAIEELLALHDTSLVLVGDTGQDDPEIYRSIVASHPGRIEAVLLRHLTSDDRAEDVHRLFADLTVPLAVAGDTLGLAEVAESNGLTPRGWTERVARSTAR